MECRYDRGNWLSRSAAIVVAAGLVIGLPAVAGAQQKRPLSPIAQNLDANKNGLLERTEARGPVVANFDTIDKDKSGSLDGDELFEFFQGGNRGGSGGSGPPANVVVDAVIEEPLSQTVPVLGRIVAGEFGPIAARIGGAVNEMRVDVGDRVERGTVLAVLDRERLALERTRHEALVMQQSAQLAGARADLQKVSLDLKRLEGIRKSAAFSQARYDDAIQEVAKQRGEVAEAKAELAQAEAQLKRANIDLQDSEIRAPYPGVVSEKHAEVGAYLNIGSPVVTLINDLDIRRDASIFYFPFTVRIHEAECGRQYTATIGERWIAGNADKATPGPSAN